MSAPSITAGTVSPADGGRMAVEITITIGPEVYTGLCELACSDGVWDAWGDGPDMWLADELVAVAYSTGDPQIVMSEIIATARTAIRRAGGAS